MDRQLTQRNGALPDLVTLLREQHAAKLDVVIPAAGLRSARGRWQIDGTGAAALGPDGVTTSPAIFVPIHYLAKARSVAPDWAGRQPFGRSTTRLLVDRAARRRGESFSQLATHYGAAG